MHRAQTCFNLFSISSPIKCYVINAKIHTQRYVLILSSLSNNVCLHNRKQIPSSSDEQVHFCREINVWLVIGGLTIITHQPIFTMPIFIEYFWCQCQHENMPNSSLQYQCTFCSDKNSPTHSYYPPPPPSLFMNYFWSQIHHDNQPNSSLY